MIVPFPAGGSADIIARAVAQALTEKLGKSFVIENRGGCRAVTSVRPLWRKQRPTATRSCSRRLRRYRLNKLMYRTMPYDPETAFEPVVLVAKSPLIIRRRRVGGFSDLKEMIAFAKANPRQDQCRASRQRHARHITSELLQQMTGVKVTNIAYRGSAPLITDLLGGKRRCRDRFHAGLYAVRPRRQVQASCL